MSLLEDEFDLTLEDDDTISLVLSDQGVAVPAAHAASHAAAGADPVSISLSQVSNAGTMAAQNSNSVTITGGSVAGITDLAVADGGTGASTAADARTNLGLGSMSTQASTNVTITGGALSGVTITGASIGSLAVDLAVADGGTGASTAAAARTNLGLGTIATQASSAVSITGGSIATVTMSGVAISGSTWNGGSIAGITDLAVADGGTGASTAAAARTNLFVRSRTETAEWNSSVTGLTGGGSALDGIDISNTTNYPTGYAIEFSVSNVLYVYRITATGAAESSPSIIRPDSYGGREWTLVSLNTAAIAITGGSIAGVTISGLASDLAVADGGTGASTLTGLLQGNGTSAFTAVTNPSAAGQVLRATSTTTFAWGALNMADTDAVTGVLPVVNGGTGGSTEAGARFSLGFISGIDTLASGSVFVSESDVSASSRIVAIHTTTGAGTQGILRVEINAGVGFEIISSQGTDANDIAYFGHI